MQPDDSNDAHFDRSHGEDQDGPAYRFQPSVKLMEKMETLAKWGIERSSIEFPRGASELRGGHATVSRALWSRVSEKSSNEGESDALNNAGQKVVAVKKLKISADKDMERLLRLALREAGFLVELSHPNIVELEGFVEDASEGIVWLVFPWEANGNLRDFIASQDWEIPERISLICDVTYGVEYLHSQNPPICHGDLKSVNILVNPDCRALITDFGSARRVAEADLEAETEQVREERQPAATFSISTNTITLTGNAYTLRWAAPELLNDEPPTLKIDIWALGWISYEVMTNAIPFEDVAKDSIVIKRVTQGDLPAITSDVRMSLMLRLCSLMSECWHSDPSQRPTARGCGQALYWMPKIVPDPQRTTSALGAAVRSPALLLELGEMHALQGDAASALRFFAEALLIFTDAADKRGRAHTLERLALTNFHQGKAEEAATLYSDALEILTSIGDKEKQVHALWGLAKVYKSQDRYSEAASLYSEALQISTDLGNTQGKSLALFGLAEVHRVQEEYSKAVTLYSDALKIDTDLGDRQGTASNLWGLATVHQLQKEYNQAITFYSEAIQIYTDIGDRRGKAFALVGLARAKRDQGHPTEAIDLCEEAVKICEQIGDNGLAAEVRECAAEARRQAEMVEEGS